MPFVRYSLIARSRVWACSVAIAGASTCVAGEADPSTRGGSTKAPPASVVDSILPVEEEIRRFRAVLRPDPGKLSSGASSRDALIDRFVEALAEADTPALADMLMTIDEFGWLYYPHTRFTTPPYELPPGLVWFQIENASSRGLGRLLERLGGRPLVVLGYTCASEPLVEGPNRFWEGCRLRLDPAKGDPEEMALFGSILERDGVFKFVSYANDY